MTKKIIQTVLTVIALAAIGGYFMWQKYSVSETVQPTVSQPIDETANWKTYKNTEKGYEISYPADAKINKTDLSCVRIDTKEFGSVYISAVSSNPCGEPTGIGTEDIRIKENIAIGNKQYETSGFRLPDNSHSFLSFGFTADDKIFVTYGVDHFDKSDPKSLKNLGALTDSEYQSALNSAKKIVSTLKLLLSGVNHPSGTANWKTYTNSQYGFEFKYLEDEKVEMLDTSAIFQNNVGTKIISLQVKNIQDVSNISCVQGIDIKCSNIFADGHNIVVRYGMLGNIIARVDLFKEKSILFSLSCDSMEEWNTHNVYCKISDQRVKIFQDLLSTFKFIN